MSVLFSADTFIFKGNPFRRIPLLGRFFERTKIPSYLAGIQATNDPEMGILLCHKVLKANPLHRGAWERRELFVASLREGGRHQNIVDFNGVLLAIEGVPHGIRACVLDETAEACEKLGEFSVAVEHRCEAKRIRRHYLSDGRMPRALSVCEDDEFTLFCHYVQLHEHVALAGSSH